MTSIRRAQIDPTKILTADDRRAAMEVVREVYLEEKRWISETEREIPPNTPEIDDKSWFLTRVDGEPAGVIRLVYDPPLELPAEMEVELDPGVDLREMATGKRFVEIGRFMIRRKYRGKIRVVTNLIQGACREVLERGYSHFLTDVYDGDPHSPLGFHTRVLGFERIGTHRHGELDVDYVRIILVLDIVRSWRRMIERKDRLFREMSAGLGDLLDRAPSQPAA
jgi:hypothetical protein